MFTEVGYLIGCHPQEIVTLGRAGIFGQGTAQQGQVGTQPGHLSLLYFRCQVGFMYPLALLL